jgi:hypothetical protein
MSIIDIDVVWFRLRQHEGENFHTVSNLPFTYSIEDNQFVPSRTKYHIGKSDFAKALDSYPLTKVSDIGNLVRGGSYVFAVLTDKRIRKSDW